MLLRFLLVLLLGTCGVPAWAADLTGLPKVSTAAENSVVISWQTDVETGTRVSYGLAPDQLTERAEGSVGAAHELTLKGLKPGTRYFFAIGTARKKLATGEFTTSGSPRTVVSPPSSSPAVRPPPTPPRSTPAQAGPPARATWGIPASLPDHFARHGGDFHAKDAEEYARMAWQFGQLAKQGGLLVKVDGDGTRRVFDPRSGAFAAYNANGTTKTYFKPNSRDYFARQPGRVVSGRTP